MLTTRVGTDVTHQKHPAASHLHEEGLASHAARRFVRACGSRDTHVCSDALPYSAVQRSAVHQTRPASTHLHEEGLAGARKVGQQVQVQRGTWGLCIKEGCGLICGYGRWGSPRSRPAGPGPAIAWHLGCVLRRGVG